MPPQPPCYAVIFTSRLREDAGGGYSRVAQEIADLAATMPGYLGFESARENGLGIAVSYWDSLESIRTWRDNERHAAARERGRRDWYAMFDVRVARVERHYEWQFEANDGDDPRSQSEDVKK